MPRVFAALIPAIFGVIGLLVLGFLWFGTRGFGEPPLFFKLFGSCIAAVFVLVGFGSAIGVLQGASTSGLSNPPTTHSPQPLTTHRGGYRCPHCGATLGKRADVSPKGDAKCEYCSKWFNIHGH